MNKKKRNKSVSKREFIKIRLSGLETAQELFFREILSKVKEHSPTSAFKRVLNTAMRIKKWQVSGETLTPATIPDPQCGWFERHPEYKRPICWRYCTKRQFPKTTKVFGYIIESPIICRDCKERDKRHDEAKQLQKIRNRKPPKVIYVEHPTRTEKREVLQPLAKATKEIRETRAFMENELNKRKAILAENMDAILRHIPEGRFKKKLVKQLGNLDTLYL